MTRALGPGDLIMGRYRLLSLLGSGGMGSVWRAEHLHLQTQVAVKLLDPRIADDDQVIARFLLEARAAASLRNRHVVQIFDYGVEEGNAFIVMEMLQGETLGARIERLGTLPVEQTIRFMCQVMRALAPAHDAGIVHRDLKPDNIFITSDEEGEYAKVLDFGVAKVTSGSLGDAGVRTQTGVMVGTPYYMSPEQAKAKAVDQRSDIWALAVITFEALTGQRPFGGDSFGDLVLNICTQPIPVPSNIAPVPAGFDEWFVRGTQRDVDKRFRSTREMAQELVALADAPLVGRRASDAADTNKGPTGTVVLSGPQAAQGSPALEAKDKPSDRARRARLHLTTGQRAATGYDAAGGGRARMSRGLVATLSVAGVLLLGAGGLYAWRMTQPETGVVTGAAVPGEQAAEDGKDAPTQPGATTPETPAEDGAAAQPQTEPTTETAEAKVEAPQDAPAPASQATSPDAAAASKKSTTSKTSRQSAPQSTPAPSSPPKSDGNKVPVVDRTALPPKDWEF